MTCRTALAIYAGAALMAAWAILRAWDHFHGRPLVTEPEPPEVQPPDPWPWYTLTGGPSVTLRFDSDNLTSADGGPVSLRWRQ
jgi:hypothetical protein